MSAYVASSVRLPYVVCYNFNISLFSNVFFLTQDPISLSAQHFIDMKPELLSYCVSLLPAVLVTD